MAPLLHVHDPLADVVDAPLFIVPRVLDGLRAYRAGSPSVARLVDTLLAGIEAHPTKFWVMKQFHTTLEVLDSADTATRDLVAGELETLMDVLGIRSSDGVLGIGRR